MQPKSELIGASATTIRVPDRGEPVEEVALVAMQLPDGRFGALWRAQLVLFA